MIDSRMNGRGDSPGLGRRSMDRPVGSGSSGSRANDSVPAAAPIPSATSVQHRVILTLDHCVLPPEKLETTPSQSHGLSREDEIDLRILGCELIQSSGILLRLPQVAMATGQVLFQRFYYSESFVRQNMEITSMACIALASKIEEAPRRFRDVINVFNHLKQLRNNQPVVPILLNDDYKKIKNAVIKAERRLLKVLGFCVHVKHPHKFIVSLLAALGLNNDRQLIQTSWNYMNDCLRSDVFCRFPADTIAVSCIYLSIRIHGVVLPDKPSWLEILDIKESDVRDVCRRILSIYARPKPDQLKLERVIIDLKDALDLKRRSEQTSDATHSKE